MSKNYRKKPVVIQAFRYGYDMSPTWFTHHRTVVAMQPDYARITTRDGFIRVNYGDYVIRGLKGELSPCSPEIFHATYEEV